MRIQLDRFENRGDYLYLQASGRFDINIAKRGIARIYRAFRKHEIPKFLIDCRCMRGRYSLIERYELSELLAREHIEYMKECTGKSIKLAVVLDKTFLEPRRFGENVARNRGLDYFNTDDIAEAFAWLGVETADGAGPDD